MSALPGKRRLGFFGGTFDPPHRGHVAVARGAADHFSLDTVLFVPTGRQPLKGEGAASWADRLAMVQLLQPMDPRFRVSDMDGPVPGGAPNYTVDTLRTLRDADPVAEIFAISGADSFLDLPRWRDPAALLRLAEWIVVNRPGFALSEIDRLPLTPEQRARVHPLGTVEDPVSASTLRAALQRNDDVSGLVPAPILAYIRGHGLYGMRHVPVSDG